MLIQVRPVLEFPEHQVGDEHEDGEGQVGPDEDPDLVPMVRGVLDLFLNIGLLPEQQGLQEHHN